MNTEQNFLHWSEADPIEPGMLIEITYKNNMSHILVVNAGNQIASLQGGTYSDVQDLLERNTSAETIRFRTKYGDWSQQYNTKKPEETYRVGQRIMVAGWDRTFIVANVDCYKVCLIDLENGQRHTDMVNVVDITSITKVEMLRMTCNDEFQIIK